MISLIFKYTTTNSKWGCLCLFGLFFSQVLYGGSWDYEYWQHFNYTNWKSGKCQLYTIGQFHFDRDASKCYLMKGAENFAYQVLPDLDLEAHYVFLRSKSRAALKYTNAHRIELEVNPSLSLDNVTVTWRNRLEISKRQGIHYIQFFFRHRILLSFPIKNCGMITGVQCYDELFYHFYNKKITQNRFAPLVVTLALTKDVSLDLFVVLRNYLSGTRWYRSLVFGTELDF